MAAYVMSDFDDVNRALTSRTSIDAQRLKKPWRKLFTPGRQRWEGMSLKIPIKKSSALNAQSRAISGNLSDRVATTTDKWSIVDSDMKSFSVKAEVDTEQLWFDDAQRNYGIMEREMNAVNESWSWKMDLWYMCDKEGTRAVVLAKYDTAGAAYSSGALANGIIAIDRTSTVGSLGRIRKGDILAVHVAATYEVRCYIKVVAIKPALKKGSGITTATDCIYGTVTGVTQTSRDLGGNGVGTGNDMRDIAAGDYIRGIGDMTSATPATGSLHPFGIDEYAKGTNTSLFGIDQTAFGSEFSVPRDYDFGSAEFSLDKLDSAMEEAVGYVMDPGDVATVLRVHPGHWRTLKVLGDAGLRTIRPMGQDVKGPLVEFGWTEFVYYWNAGKPVGIWVDPCQNYNTIDLLNASAFQEYFPPNKPAEDWFTDPRGGGIGWFPTTTRSTRFEAWKIHHGILICPDPEGTWFRMKNVAPKAYA